MPQCRKCKIDKPDESFCYSNLKRGYYLCTDCCKDYRIYYKRNINTIMKSIYSHQKHRTKIEYTYKEFCEWLYKETKFYIYYRFWVESDYDKFLLPSVIRKDFLKHFTLDNLEVTVRKNIFTKNKRSTIKRVVQMDEAGNVLATFPSSHIAGKMLGLNYSNIFGICSGYKGRKFCGGYRWKFAA